jgi:hypothetical protein
MRSRQKKMLENKQNPQTDPEQSDDLIVITGAGSTADTMSYSGGVLGDYSIGPLTSIDTITIDSSVLTNNYSTSNVTWGGSQWGSHATNVDISTNGINIKEQGDIKIGERSLKEFMDKVEDRLAILHPNKELEERWETLKSLRRQYEELEKDILEKEKIMKILKEQ